MGSETDVSKGPKIMGSKTDMLMKPFNLAARVHKTHIIITVPRFNLEIQTEKFLFKATKKNTIHTA
jgi:hypothetical protein